MSSRFCRCASSFAAVSIFALISSLAFAVDVPQWSTYEITLAATGSYTNPYANGPSLNATFTGPAGATKSVSGFWDGGNTFKVRFTPTAQGAWTYTTRSGDQGLNGSGGTINATAPSDGQHGFLRVDPNYRTSFVWDDGTRYFMMGQTCYDWIQAALVNDNWKIMVDKSLAHGMSKIRFNVYAQGHYGNVHASDYPDAYPYAGSSTSPDRDHLNIAYWRKLDEMVQFLSSKGMVADLIVTSPYRNGRVFGTHEQNDRFVKYVVSRYAAYPNVTWCLVNEWAVATKAREHPQGQADFNRMGSLIRDGDPWLANGAALRPLSTHQNTRIDFQFFDASWPTHALIQFGPRNNNGYANGDQWGNAGIVYNLGHHVPVVNDEYGYISDKGGVPMTRVQSRRTIWGIVTAGGYGTNGDWRIITKDGTTIRPSQTGDWVDAPEYGDIKRLVEFFTAKGIAYWKMASHNELKVSGTRTYVLAEPGRRYVVYAATGGKFSLELAEGEYFAYQYDPRTGETTRLSKVTGGGTRSFNMPDSTNDWVLHLTRFKKFLCPNADLAWPWPKEQRAAPGEKLQFKTGRRWFRPRIRLRADL